MGVSALFSIQVANTFGGEGHEGGDRGDLATNFKALHKGRAPQGCLTTDPQEDSWSPLLL